MRYTQIPHLKIMSGQRCLAVVRQYLEFVWKTLVLSISETDYTFDKRICNVFHVQVVRFVCAERGVLQVHHT